MFSRQLKLAAFASVALLGASGYYLYSAYSAQGAGTLSQSPMNVSVSVPPAFVMAVDDSGSMTFQTLFPAQDGAGCWNTNRQSFFDSSGALNTSGTCYYYYVLPGDRLGNGRYTIPPLDSLGFARSATWNPTYFDPAVVYEPWESGQSGVTYGNASTTATKIDPRYSDTLSIASNDLRTDSGNQFVIQKGMVIPAGVRFRSGNNNYQFSSDYTWNGNASYIYIQYTPATFFMPYTSDSDARPSLDGDATVYSGVTRTKVANACGTGCAMWKYTISSSNTAALQNFANWYSYYGNRNRAMIAGMTRSMLDVNNMRVGYFQINQYGSYDNPLGSNSERVTMYDMGVDTEKSSLYTRMLALTASGGTPNRYAVNAAGLQFTRTDSGAPVQLQCQKNAVMLFTDGYSNNDGPSVGNVDGDMGIPFSDGNSNTLADIAAKYYVNTSAGQSPLRSDLPAGAVPVPDECNEADPDKSLDCQANLHVNFYGITLGAKGDLYDPDLDQDAYTDSSVYSNWPPRENNEPSTVDDIWHAATNTRGEYINARTPVDITDAMRRILASVGEGSTPAGSISLTGSRIGEGSLTVVPFYASANSGTDWYSQLTAQTVTRNSSTGVLEYTTSWEAASSLPVAASRNIYVSTTSGASLFNASNVTLASLCSNTASGMSRCTASSITNDLGITLAQAVAYLRGDQSLESTTLRERTTRLGDIVNSTAVISAPTDDYGYKSMHESGTTNYDHYNYADFLTSKKSSASTTVYVGANDGMLHAFDGETGVEKFAFIPQSVLGHMGNLLFPYNADDKNDQVFQHRYYVDGPVTVSDVAYGVDDWATVLVGTPGAGGKGAFALDVSNPSAFTASSKLWEINDTSSDSAIANNIGNVLGKPVIVPVRSSAGSVSWKAIFGNGYGSTNGKAVLFVVDIESGKVTLIPAVETGMANANGLGNIIVVDRWSGTDLTTATRDGYADTVYGADQNGAVWKFDLRSVTADPASTATLTTVTTPVFVAKDDSGSRQPILGGLEAASGSGGGVMLYFGTGSFSFEVDATDMSQQTFYGVLDSASGASTTTLYRDDLLEQEIVSTSDDSRQTTRYSLGVNDKGWYLDLASGGERFVGYPAIESGIVFFTTFDPSSSSDCATGGANWLYGLDALSGAAALSGVSVGSPSGDSYTSGTGAVKLSTTGSAPVKDVAVMTTSRLSPLASDATDDELDDALSGQQCSMVIQASGASALYMPRACGRQSWRQVK